MCLLAYARYAMPIGCCWMVCAAPENSPGKCTRSQNWIGGTRPANAAFVPPPPGQVGSLLGDLERFIHEPAPTLLPAGEDRAGPYAVRDHPPISGLKWPHQPLADGCPAWVLLPKPLTYISGYLKQHQAEHYRRLSAVHTTGNWEGWVAFFFEGVEAAATRAERGIAGIASLVAADRRRVLASPKAGPASYRFFEMLP